ncbi:transcription cofactor HES-6-like [Eudromia elegans]
MAPCLRAEEPLVAARRDRKRRKPLVERRRRARINESLRELRELLAEGEARLENAEVLELTVRRVRAVLERRPRGPGPGRRRSRPAEGARQRREASERFAAGYIQCMHEVHTFVSACPAVEAATAAELLRHLLRAMPLGEAAVPGVPAGAWAEPAAPPRDEERDEEAEAGRTAGAALDASPLPGSSPAKAMWRPW